MTIELTARERAVLDHKLIIETPEQWVARNVARVGEAQTREWLDAKVQRWQFHYLAEVTTDGDLYRDAKWNYAHDSAHDDNDAMARAAAEKQRREAEREEIVAEAVRRIRATEASARAR